MLFWVTLTPRLLVQTFPSIIFTTKYTAASLDCPAYAGKRAEMEERVAHVAGRQGMPASDAGQYLEMRAGNRLLVLLRRRLGSVKVEAAVDRCF